MKLKIKLAVVACLGAVVSAVVAGPITPSTAENLFGPNLNATSVTNGATLTCSVGGTYVVSPISGTNGATCTVTLADPIDVGKVVVLYVPAPQTNILGIADSGNFLGAGALALGTNDTATIQSVASNQWVLISTSNN